MMTGYRNFFSRTKLLEALMCIEESSIQGHDMSSPCVYFASIQYKYYLPVQLYDYIIIYIQAP